MARPDWNSTIPDRAPSLTSIGVCYVDGDDRRPAPPSLERSDAIEVRTAGTPSGLFDALVEVDCVVSDAGPDLERGVAVRETVRERDAELPVVLVTSDGADAIVIAIHGTRSEDGTRADAD